MSPKVPKGYKIILILGLASLVLLPVLSMLVVDIRRFPQIPALVAGIVMFCFLAVALSYGAFYLLRPEPALDWADLLQSLAIVRFGCKTWCDVGAARCCGCFF